MTIFRLCTGRPVFPLSSLTLLIAALPNLAEASPWTLPKGKVVLSTSVGYQFTSREFLDSYDSRPFPLAGRYDAGTVELAARVGITDRFEFGLNLPFKVVSYQADPVILLPRPEGLSGTELDYYQDNVINLSQNVAGVADIGFTARFRLLKAPVAVTAEVTARTPTGYKGPSGTFGDRPESQATFLQDVTRFVRPENVTDDVTLGDAQMDLTSSLLAGGAFSSGTFVRGSAGYNLRLGGAGDQFVAGLRVGQMLHPKVLIFAGADFRYAIQDGRVIGVSVAAEDPELPARDYGGVENLRLREVRLDHDALEVSGGLIIRLTNSLEMNLAFQETAWGRNTSAIRVVSLGFALRTELGDGS